MTSYQIWECLICGFIYDESLGMPEDNIAPGTRWEDIPDDWLCPDCGVGKQDFEMIEVKKVSVANSVAQPAVSEVTDNKEQPLVIIGAGLAAYNLVKAFRQHNTSRPITLVCADDGNFSVASQRGVLWRVDGFKWHKARNSSLSGLICAWADTRSGRYMSCS